MLWAASCGRQTPRSVTPSHRKIGDEIRPMTPLIPVIGECHKTVLPQNTTNLMQFNNNIISNCQQQQQQQQQTMAISTSSSSMHQQQTTRKSEFISSSLEEAYSSLDNTANSTSIDNV